MISGQWFQRKRSKIWKNLYKIIHYIIKNRGNTLILTNLVGVYPRNIHTKFATNQFIRLRDSQKWVKKDCSLK